MPRSSINLELYKAEIISLFQNDNFSASIATILQTQYNLKITDCTVKSHLQKWEIHKWNYLTISNTVLHAWIKILFFEIGLKNTDLLQVLEAESFEITLRTLKKLQLQLNLQHQNFFENQQQIDKIIQAIQKKLKQDIIERYEKKLLHHHFKSRDILIAW